MNAKEAKALAEINKKQINENLAIREEKSKNVDASLLVKCFHDKIEDAVKKGHTSTENISFPMDRFSDEVIRRASEVLSDDGFNLEMNKHIAFKTLSFKISWAA